MLLCPVSGADHKSSSPIFKGMVVQIASSYIFALLLNTSQLENYIVCIILCYNNLLYLMYYVVNQLVTNKAKVHLLYELYGLDL